MEWLRKLSNAVDYIESNLEGVISYEEAAQIACCSTYYFQRIFSYVAGIPLSEYIRRRKMTQAAFELQSTDAKVLDVAMKYGYTSPTAFNWAFQSIHGIPPVSAKSRGSVLNAYPPIRFSVKVTGGSAMPYRIEEKEAIRIVGIRIPLTEDMEKKSENCPAFLGWSVTRKPISGNLQAFKPISGGCVGSYGIPGSR
jgi:AraC family transcriptional regulator